MYRCFLLVLIPCCAIISEKTGEVSIESMQRMQQRQFSQLPSYQVTTTKYDSTKDPFFKDKEVESYTYTTQSIYTHKKIRQVIIQDKEVLQLAPPSPIYVWHTEYYFEKDRLYYVNFRYRLKIQNDGGGAVEPWTDIIVFLPKGAPWIAYQKTESEPRKELEKPIRWDKGFVKIKLETADETGMTTAVLKDGILKMIRGKRN